ncbi:tape measure domain protein [gut metagenome]|uniref:Tape measure domain protein n=1 Tax=gut metagenome TaxID=749906 RepID=J9H3B1_9ZZZZ
MNAVQVIIDIAARGDRVALRKINALQERLGGADAAAKRLANTTGGRLRKAFMSLPGASFFTNPVVALATGAGIVGKLGMETEKTATAFRVLAGSQETSAKLLGQLNEYADNTVWNRPDIQEAAKTMMGFGVSTETVFKDLRMLGDVAMGDRNKLQSLALVFGQISAAGKLQGQDLLQLINAGYNPLLDISELTGKSVAQLKDEMGKGAISADLVRKAFERATGQGGRFADMVDNIAKTAPGAFEQLKGKGTAGLLKLYDTIQPLLIPAFNTMSQVLEKVFNILGGVMKFLVDYGRWLLPVAAAITAYSIAVNRTVLSLKVWMAIQKVLNVLMNLNPVGLVVAGIAALAATIAVCWNKFAGFRAVVLTVWDTMKGFAGILKDLVIDRITNLLTGIGKVGEALSRLFRGDFSGAWSSAKSAVSLISGHDARSKAFGRSAELISGMGSNYSARLVAERTKKAISDPKAAAGTEHDTGHALAPSSFNPTTVANDITTGGTRNTSITLNISKFWEDTNVYQSEDIDMNTLSRKILEAINRSLEAATAAAR